MDPNDENEDVIIAVTRVRLEIYWHKLLARINNVLFRITVRKIFWIRALIQYYFHSFPRRVTHVHSARRHSETYNFSQFDTHVTNAKTDKGTHDWTKGDYRKCPKLMQLV